ncbi:MAG: amino acid adenylation domain-containing protein [Vicinamibacterales bacterium]
MTTVTQNANTDAFRLSLQQRTLWTVQQAAGQDAGQAVGLVALTGRLQSEVLQRALQQLVARHEILRTTFQRPPGIKTPFQIVSPLPDYSWQIVDAGSLPAADQQRAIDDGVAREIERSVDLERGPLLRVTLVRQADDRHLLILSLPILCADARTLANITRELGVEYESSMAGQTPPGEPLQYADFAQWQEELLHSEDEPAVTGKGYWIDLARTAAPAPGLPLRKRATGARIFHEGAVPIRLDAALGTAIGAAARAHDVTIPTVLFAAWQALLWRLGGEPEAAFTVHRLADGRSLEDLQSAVGLYAKHLPMRCAVRNERFADLLRRVAGACAEADEWQDYADAEPAFDAAVGFEFADTAVARAAAGVLFSPLAQHVRLRPFALTLSCVRSGEALSAELLYNRHEFDQASIARWAGYFERFLAAVVTDADRTPDDVQILSDEERIHLLLELNRTEAEFPRGACIHALIQEQAARTPDAIAVVAAPRELTYRELNERANQLAHLLRRRGVMPNVRVGLCIGRSVDLIVGLLGIVKAGGAYVPLNPEHPPARLALQLQESQARLLVTHDQAVGGIEGFDGDIIDLTRDRALLEAEPQGNLTAAATPDSLVYVIYTSGSTGTPKGVGVPHRSLVNYTHFILRRLQVTGPLHFATVSTITADLGNTCIFPALVSGGCLHVLAHDVSMDHALFQRYVAARPLDVLKIVPSHLSTLGVSPSDGSLLPAKYLILGGEPLRWELVQQIALTHHTCEVINHYGPTETTVGCLTYAVSADGAAVDSLTVPIGRPIANTRAYVLDSRLRLVPTGVVGELYIGGEGVADGYVNGPAETAARFLPDPFVDDLAARVYRTGDLARHLADGAIEFVGRADDQVKVRGFRVEPGEIEAVLAATPGVRQAIVVVTGGPSGDQRLIAYVTLTAEGAVSQEALRAAAAQRLPDYMVPSSFVVLAAMPLTPNGKVDRAALPAPDQSRPELARVFVAPRTAVERELANIWAAILSVGQVGVHDNFFELGGHSLLATRVVSQMRRVFKLDIPLGRLFEFPTVAALAQEIERSTGNAAAALLIDVAELEQLSDEEAARLLAVEADGGGADSSN